MIAKSGGTRKEQAERLVWVCIKTTTSLGEIGLLRTARGQPVAEARVYLTRGPAPLPDIAALTDEQGGFSFGVPAPGEYVLECAAEGRENASATVRVPAGKARRATVELRFQA